MLRRYVEQLTDRHLTFELVYILEISLYKPSLSLCKWAYLSSRDILFIFLLYVFFHYHLPPYSLLLPCPNHHTIKHAHESFFPFCAIPPPPCHRAVSLLSVSLGTVYL